VTQVNVKENIPALRQCKLIAHVLVVFSCALFKTLS
jgi:hypothetical protein